MAAFHHSRFILGVYECVCRSELIGVHDILERHEVTDIWTTAKSQGFENVSWNSPYDKLLQVHPAVVYTSE